MLKEIINEIRYYQMFLYELISDYCLNESICDFYEHDRSNYRRYGNNLSNISKALKYRQHMLSYLLFYDDKDSKSIPKLLRRLKDTKVLEDKKLDSFIKYLSNDIQDLLKSAETDITNLKEYRHNIYAHWNKNSFKAEWQEQFKNEHVFDFEKIFNISQKCIEIFTEIICICNECSYIPLNVDMSYINLFIDTLKN